MQLTRVLMFYKNLRKVPGSLYAGKHRVYRPIRNRDRQIIFAQLMREQENLSILSQPYITKEEEHGHMVDIGRKGLAFEAMKLELKSKMLPHKTIEEHLQHVDTARRWE